MAKKTTSKTSELFAEALIWKCENELLAEAEREAGRKLALGLDVEGDGTACLAVVAQDLGWYETRNAREKDKAKSCVFVADPAGVPGRHGLAISVEASKKTMEKAKSGRILLSDPAVSEKTRQKLKHWLFELSKLGGCSVRFGHGEVVVEDPDKLVSFWQMANGELEKKLERDGIRLV